MLTRAYRYIWLCGLLLVVTAAAFWIGTTNQSHTSIRMQRMRVFETLSSADNCVSCHSTDPSSVALEPDAAVIQTTPAAESTPSLADLGYALLEFQDSTNSRYQDLVDEYLQIYDAAQTDPAHVGGRVAALRIDLDMLKGQTSPVKWTESQTDSRSTSSFSIQITSSSGPPVVYHRTAVMQPVFRSSAIYRHEIIFILSRVVMVSHRIEPPYAAWIPIFSQRRLPSFDMQSPFCLFSVRQKVAVGAVQPSIFNSPYFTKEGFR
jgi:hypothetical protein